jgi:Xaa-Pro aminopeptidase
LQRARTLLAKDEVDLVVVTSPPNVRYFGQQKEGIQGIVGWWNSPKMFLLSISKNVTPVLVTNVMDAWDVLAREDNPFEPRFYGGFVMEFGERLDDQMKRFKRTYDSSLAQPRDAFQLLYDYIASWNEEGSLNLGVEGHHLPSLARDIVRRKFPQIRLKDVDATLQRIRMIKTDAEVDLIRQSSRINVRGFKAAVEEIRPGAKESSLAQAYLEEITKFDARPCYVMINAGPKSASLFPSYDKPYTIKKVDTVRIDVGCEYRGYCSDVSRTVAVGNISEQKRRIIKATTRGYVETIKRLRPGLAIKDVFDQAVSIVRASGIPDYRRTNVGHGIGIQVHELPDLTPNEVGVLESNMVINVETPYYSFGVGGFPGEDTVRITENSYELLARLERTIEV